MPEVPLERVMSGRLAQPVRVTGALKSDEVVAVSTKVQALVRRVAVKEGDRVRKGQLLVELDDGELRAQARTSRDIKNAAAKSDHQRAGQALVAARSRLTQMQETSKITDTEVASRAESAASAVQTAKDHLKVLRDGARHQEERTAELAAAKAQAQVNRARDMWRRRAELAARGLASREEADNARRDLEVAQAELNQANEQMSLVKEGPRGEEIRVAEEQVRQAEASAREAEANRARRKLSNEDVAAAETQVQQAQATLDAATAALAQT